MTETLTAGDASVTIDHDHGGRLSSFTVAGQELLVDRDTGTGDTGWGCFPMVPWAGRIRGGRFHADLGHGDTAVQLPLTMPPHAIHGTTYRAPWERVAPGVLETDLGPDWPWRATVRQVVDLGHGRLSLTISVTTAPGETEAMPVVAGWHPWFRRHVGRADLAVHVPAERMWRRDGDGIPDGRLVEPPPGPWDDCFTALVGPVELHWPGLLRLHIESDCEHVVVYDEQDLAVCVEPQSAPPDAHNSGEDLVFVDPGDSWSITTTWFWTED